jgi:Zn-dependent peptidase ImmA (M78 family)
VEDTASRLKQRLRKIGLSDPAIEAAWPEWWSDAADASVSAQAELRFSLARKLGLDPHSLLEDNAEPRFIWRDEARFKHLSGEGQLERAAITSFGMALGRYLIDATSASPSPASWDSMSLRNAILREQPYVRLLDILSVCWSLGIPVIHLRIFPCARKRMSAMAVRVGGRTAIMLGKDSMYPPHIAFYLAHELAHIALGHLAREPVVVDFDSPDLATSSDDPEEIGADRFALELLTGVPQPKVLPQSQGYSARELARVAMEAAPQLSIEPGTLALCFGYSTGDWATANAAIQRIYSGPRPVWAEVNRVAASQLAFDLIPDDSRAYLKAILGDVWSA